MLLIGFFSHSSQKKTLFIKAKVFFFQATTATTAAAPVNLLVFAVHIAPDVVKR